jgi:hypothetical protein
MKVKPWNELSLAELQAKEKALKLAIVIFAGMLIVMLLISAFLTIKQGFGVFTVLPIAFLPLLMANMANLKKLKTEIESRGK